MCLLYVGVQTYMYLGRCVYTFNEKVQTSFAETAPHEVIHTSAAMCLRESISLSSFYAFPKDACEHALLTQREWLRPFLFSIPLLWATPEICIFPALGMFL